MVININITDKRASVAGAPVIVCGNSDYSIKFTFDDEWGTNTYKTARFVYVRGGRVLHEDRGFTGDSVQIPMLKNTQQVHIGVFQGDIHTTTPAVIPCELSILCGSGEPAEPAPDTDPETYSQIVELLNLAIVQQEEATAATNTATTAAQTAEAAAQTAAKAADTAASAATAAEEAKADIEELLGGVVGAETPHFDLAALGLPALAIGAAAVELTTDTAELRAALDKGAVRLTFTLNMGENMPVSVVMNNITAMGSYICAYTFEFYSAVIQLVFEIYEGSIVAFAKDLFGEINKSLGNLSTGADGLNNMLDLINGEEIE